MNGSSPSPDSPLAPSAYDVLGVAPGAGQEELRRAFRRRLRQTHPDAGGDAAVFVRVQRAWEQVGTPAARAAYDRGRGAAGGGEHASDSPAAGTAPRAGSRPRARSSGLPGGWRRERYLAAVREWAGRGSDIPDPYRPALVRQLPREIRALLARAAAEEATARVIAELGIGYTAWHGIALAERGRADAELDHVVLGPSGLYGMLSLDFGGPVGFRRGELVGPAVPGAPVSALVTGIRETARSARVRFGGAILVLPDDDLPAPVTPLGGIRGIAVVAAGRAALAGVLRQGVPGAPDLGGTAVFDMRTRVDQAVRLR